MMNDFADLTDSFQDILDFYTGEYGAVVDLDAWNTDDLMTVIRIVENVLELRGAEYAPSEDDDYL